MIRNESIAILVTPLDSNHRILSGFECTRLSAAAQARHSGNRRDPFLVTDPAALLSRGYNGQSMSMKAKDLLTVFLLLLLVGPGPRVHGREQKTETEPFSAISNRKITEPDLTEAISKLHLPAKEAPQYWSRIANDPGYSRSWAALTARFSGVLIV
jgi:hypothetical protein